MRQETHLEAFGFADIPGQGGGAGEVPAHDVEALPRVALEFHQRLTHLPIGIWASVASDDAHGAHAPDPDPDAKARHRLRRVMDGQPATVARVRRRIEDTMAAADGFVSRSAMPRMQRVALTAALALVARADLPAEDFHRLYRPFADLIPERELPA